VRSVYTPGTCKLHEKGPALQSLRDMLSRLHTDRDHLAVQDWPAEEAASVNPECQHSICTTSSRHQHCPDQQMIRRSCFIC
jgi:hypothetical protein